MTNTPETEVETKWRRAQRRRRSSRFLKGPIQLELLQQAASPIAELRLMIMPGLKEMVEAVPTDE